MLYQTWTTDDIEVYYTVELDGDGRSMAALFIDYLKTHHADRLPFECAFEWCAGPGFIGFALLAAGVCKRLVLADINPNAVEAAKATVYHNALDERVRIYQGDNLAAVPDSEKFDLVVGNPPNFFCLNPAHPRYSQLKDDLRPNDPGWKLHREFYGKVPAYLNRDAVLCIEEVDPFATKCYMPNLGSDDPLWGPEPFDLRMRPPVDDFVPMITQAGLEYIKTVRLPHPTVPVHLMISRWAGSDRATTRFRAVDGLDFYVSAAPTAQGQVSVMATRGGGISGSIKISRTDTWITRLFAVIATRKGHDIDIGEVTRELNAEPTAVRQFVAGLRAKGWVT